MRALMTATVPSMIGQFNMNNIKLLLELGYNVDVACNLKNYLVWSDEKINNLKNTLDDLNVSIYQVDFERSMFNISSHIKSYKQIKQLMNNRDYDLIHTHTPISSLITRIAYKNSKIFYKCRMIYTAHGFHFFEGNHFLKNFLFKNIEKFGAHFTDILITINSEDYKAAKEFKLKKNGCVQYVPGIGIDVSAIQKVEPKRAELLQELRLDNHVRLLVSVGELNKNKNHKVVIEALAKLPEKFHYIICGKGDLKNELIDLAKKYGCRERLHLLDYRKDVVAIVKSCDYFVFPSKREGLSVALMEALVSNAVCLVSNIRGNTDLIYDKKNGFLFDIDENTSKNIYSIIYEIEKNGVCFDETTQKNVLTKIDKNSIEKDMKHIYQM